jgi:hypothetical protein
MDITAILNCTNDNGKTQPWLYDRPLKKSDRHNKGIHVEYAAS